MRFKVHPDGFVRVRDGATIVYMESIVNFEADAGVKLPDMPEGMVMVEYDSEAKVLVYSDAKGNAFPVAGNEPWEFGEAAVAGIEDAGARRATRMQVEAATLEQAKREEEAAREAAAPVGAAMRAVSRSVKEF